MDRSEALARFGAEPRAYLATITPRDTPHIVPITFAVVDNAVVTAIDHKPKQTTRLQRLLNIELNPNASMITDHYTEDWERLWWVRVDGRVEVREAGRVDRSLRDALADKYGHYSQRPPEGPYLVLQIADIRWWEGS